MKNITKTLFLLALLFSSGIVSAAAPSGPPPPAPPPPPTLPLDGNAIVLITICAIYGLYKLQSFNNKKASI